MLIVEQGSVLVIYVQQRHNRPGTAGGRNACVSCIDPLSHNFFANRRFRYYLLYGDKIQAFPKGFQLIAGDKRLRNFPWPVPDPPKSSWSGDQVSQTALSQKALGFNCLNYGKAPEGSLFRHFMPDKGYLDANCNDGIRVELMFPSCWNGKDVDSPDHKSHMAYPDHVMDGSCPSGFQTRLPSLFFEIIYDTFAFRGQAGKFVFSHGDTKGKGSRSRV